MVKFPWKRGKLPEKKGAAGMPKQPAIRPQFDERALRDFIKVGMKLPKVEETLTPQESLSVARVAEEVWDKKGRLPNDPLIVLIIEHKMKAYTMLRELKIEGVIKGDVPTAINREVNPLVGEINRYVSEKEIEARNAEFANNPELARGIREHLFDYEKKFVIPAAGAALHFTTLGDIKTRYESMRDKAMVERETARKNAEGWKQHAEAARQRRDKKAFDEAVKNLNSWNSITTSWDGRAKELVDGLNMINGYLKGMEKNVTMFKELWKGGR